MQKQNRNKMIIEDYSWTSQDQKKYDNDMNTLSLAVSKIIDSYISLKYVDVQFNTLKNCVIKCSREMEYTILKDRLSFIISRLDKTDVQLTDSKISLSRINLTITVENFSSYKNGNKTVHETKSLIINS